MTEIEFKYKLISIQDSLMNFANSLTTDKDYAKDLVQETFLRSLKYCDKFVYESNFRAWVFTIMKNTFINDYRRLQHHNTFNYSTNEKHYLNYITASGSYNPDSIYSSKELEKIIETLDDDSKLPLKMYYEGFRYQEIAERLQVNIGTVKSRIFFSRKKLKKLVNS